MSTVRLSLVCGLFFSAFISIWAQCPISVNAGDDVYLCAPPTPTQLNGDVSGPYLNFAWTPTTGMSGGNSLSPTVTVNQTTTYVLTATAPDFGGNLVDNGDFEQGNSGFTSDYGFNPGDLVPEGLYDVIDNPQDDHPGFAPCEDHTSGDGNMMVVNGAGTPNQNVWCQTIPVTPNTQYVLSAWVTSVVAASPALLQFNINGVPLGGIFNAPGGTCNWQNFFQVWNSGGNTDATICIVNQNTQLGGNDFALDDIVFAPVCTVTDTVVVNVINLTAIASPPIAVLPCEGASLQLSGNGSSTGPNVTYEWTTNTGNIVSGGNTLTPTVDAAGEYILTVSYEVNGSAVCTKTATVNVIVSPNPLSTWITTPLPLGCGSPTTVLIGNSSQAAFSIYEWTTLDGNIVSGEDLKNCVVNMIGTYNLLVTNTVTGCTATTEVTVTQTNDVPTAVANSNGIITCANDSVPLFGIGSTNGNNITYSWTTITGQITGPTNVLNTSAGAGGLYILHVTNISNNCTSNDTVVVPANVTPPSVIGTLPPQISCDPNQDTISLFIFVGPPPFVLINWTTADGHIVSGQYTPAPQANQPGTYAVSVFDPANGCYNFDTSQVIANFTVPMADILPADTVTCQSPSIQLEGSGSSVGANFSINWTASNGGNIVSGQNTLNPTVNASGDYMLILRDSISLCADTAMVSVLADTNVVVAIANAPDTLNCVVNSVTLNANGSSNGSNLTYFWTSTDGIITGGQGTPNPTAGGPGTYQLLLTNTSNGCSATDLAIVEQNTSPPNVSIATPGALSCTVLTQIIQAQNMSPAGVYTYQWTASNGGSILSGEDSLTPTVNQPGLYTLVTTSLTNGCSTSTATNVILDATLPNALVAAPGPLTCVAATQTLNANGSSSGPNIVYAWSSSNGNIVSGANTTNPIVSEPGNYTLLVTDTLNGCTATTNALVLQDTMAPIASILSPEDTLNCLSSQLELLGNGTGVGVWTTSTGNILFASGFTAQIDAPGMYLFSTTDPNNGCVAIDSLQIFENVQIPTLSIATPPVLNCIIQDVTLNSSSSGQNLQFDWQTSTGNIVSGQNTPTPQVDAAGNYVLLLTDGINGCTNTATITVLQDTVAPNIQVMPPATITCDDLNITLEGQNLSLPGVFQYTWTASGGANIVSGATGLSPVIDMGGLVTFACFDLDNGCSSELVVTVPQNTNLPTANAGPDNTLSCLTNTLMINGSGSGAANLDYNWQASNGGVIVSGGNTPNPVISQAGTYTLTVENPVNGCTATDIVEILSDANAPAANAGAAATLTCALLQTNLNATASTGSNFTYNWTASPGGNISAGQNTLTPTVTEPGVYTLAVTNSTNGCIATSSVSVPENVTPPGVDAGSAGLFTCANTSLSLAGSSTGGAATYLWTTTNGTILNGANSLNPLIGINGNYILTATLTSNGCSASAPITVGIDTLPPAFQLLSPGLLTCIQDESALNATVQQPGAGNFTATWTSANGQISGDPNSLNTTASAPGLYVLTIQSALNGCTAQQTTSVVQDIQAPAAVAAPGGNLTCAIQNVDLDGTGSSVGNNFNYLWTSSAGGIILSGANTLSPNVGSAGTYTLLVTNNTNGCTALSSTNVGANTTPPVAAAAVPQILTCLQTAVSIDGTSSSQGPNFSASWSSTGGNIVSGQGTFTIMVNEPATYQLIVLNQQNGCTSSAQITVQENINTPGALILPADPLDCIHPELTLFGSSPTIGALTYAWTATAGGNIVTGVNSPTPMVDEPGAYTLLVSNPSNGCTSTTTLILEEIPDPVFVPSFTQPNCHLTTGSASFGPVSGGIAPFQYSIDGGLSFSAQTQFSGLVPDTYSLVVSGANGCTVEESITIEPPFLPLLDVQDIHKIEQGDSIQLAPITNVPATQIASWEWSPATGLSCIDCAEPWAKPFYSQYYSVRIEDTNGCSAESRILVQVSRKRHIYPPNIFSPDEDGENDRFTLYTKGVKEIRRLAVYDRWGEEVFLRKNFQPNDPSLGWDGTFRGNPMTPAVFVWAAEVEYIDGEIEVLYGDVTITR